jgi:hypothetical protein
VASTLALPFRVVHVPTTWIGYVVAWLAEGYRTASPLERLLIFPSWAILRALFVVGYRLSHVLYAAARCALAE